MCSYTYEHIGEPREEGEEDVVHQVRSKQQDPNPEDNFLIRKVESVMWCDRCQ